MGLNQIKLRMHERGTLMSGTDMPTKYEAGAVWCRGNKALLPASHHHTASVGKYHISSTGFTVTHFRAEACGREHETQNTKRLMFANGQRYAAAYYVQHQPPFARPELLESDQFESFISYWSLTILYYYESTVQPAYPVVTLVSSTHELACRSAESTSRQT